MKSIYESILDDEDEVMDNIGKSVLSEWVKKYIKGDYKMMPIKSGGYKVWGNMYIKNCPDEVIPDGFYFTFFEGTLAISKCNFKSLNGLFKESSKILNLNIKINECDNLVNLEGLPWAIVGNLSLSNNKMLKHLDGIPEFIQGNIDLLKNGKRFKDVYVRSLVRDGVEQIYCSLEDEDMMDELITEALNEPHLNRLSKQLKEYAKIHDNSSVTFKRLLNKYGVISWDKVTHDYTTEYRPIDKKALTAARKIITGAPGIILLMDENGKYTHIINDDKQMFDFRPDGWTAYSWVNYKSTELIEVIQRAYKMVIIKLPHGSDENSPLDPLATYELTRARRASQEGVIPVGLSDEEYKSYYHKLARENRRRYEAILTKMRAEKDPDLDKLGVKVGEIMQRFMKLNLQAQSGKIKMDSWDLSYVNRYMYGEKVYLGYKAGRSNYHGDDGLIILYSRLSEAYLSIKQAKDSDAAMYKSTYKRAKENLTNKIRVCEEILKKYGL